MNENEMQLTASVMRWRVVSVISMVVATFALLVSIGANHHAEECNNGVRNVLKELQVEERRNEANRYIYMNRMESLLKSMKDQTTPRPRQAKKV